MECSTPVKFILFYLRELRVVSLGDGISSSSSPVCPDFDLVVVEKCARDYDLFQIPQVVFLTMLLNDAVKLGVLCGWMIGIMESQRVAVEHLPGMGRVPRDEGGVVPWSQDHIRGKVSYPPRPLPKDHWDLCPSFTLTDAKETTCDFDIPEIVQATFYAMVVNNAVELFVVSTDMARALKSTLKGLRWTTFESYLSVNKRALLEAQLLR
ncbi:hypothetical protein Cgig2_022678 [Carnegiea gigantea]|uniref:Uncharacterized protein n=1 Tax=Carnegiea gigantea TaxID=171969 RepID=A0A9Q1QFT8_9CARY|nr:hypothetical protein Cgig2_022678 [Carnegiea gigantea]